MGSASATSIDLTPLRDQLQAIVAGGRPASAPWVTGIASLDRSLGGGIPRGRITEISGPLAVGKTALMRQVIAQVLLTGGWVAWIDARHTLAPAPWAGIGQRFVVIRPPDPRRSAWIADLLLRSGVFAMVVLDGAPPLSRVHGVRLAQLARERDAACVTLEHTMTGDSRINRLAGTVRLHITAPPSMQQHVVQRIGKRAREQTAAEPPPPAARRFVVIVEKGHSGSNRTSGNGRLMSVEVSSAIVMARRVCTDSEIPDRRGVARSARRPWTARGNSSDAAQHGAQYGEHPVTWGGLGVGSQDLYGVDLPGHPARLAAGRAGHPGADRQHPTTEQERITPHTRDWTQYRGRRRAADPGYGRRTRREFARDRTGTPITSHSGQSQGSNNSPRRGRDGPA